MYQISTNLNKCHTTTAVLQGTVDLQPL